MHHDQMEGPNFLRSLLTSGILQPRSLAFSQSIKPLDFQISRHVSFAIEICDLLYSSELQEFFTLHDWNLREYYSLEFHIY